MRKNLIGLLCFVMLALVRPILGIFTEKCRHQQILQVCYFPKSIHLQKDYQNFIVSSSSQKRCCRMWMSVWQRLNRCKECAGWWNVGRGGNCHHNCHPYHCYHCHLCHNCHHYHHNCHFYHCHPGHHCHCCHHNCHSSLSLSSWPLQSYLSSWSLSFIAQSA